MELVFHTIIPIQSKLTYFPDACCVFHQYFQPTHLLFIVIPNQCKHFQMTRVLKVLVLLSGFYTSEIDSYHFEGYYKMFKALKLSSYFIPNSSKQSQVILLNHLEFKKIFHALSIVCKIIV